MKTAGAITFGAVLVSAAVSAAALRETSETGLTIRTYRTDSPSRVPVTEVTGRSSGSEHPVALLVHGFQCNRSMMMPLAKHLAAHGIDAYAVDLPGHGASLERFSEKRARDAAREALDAIIAARGTSTVRVILIGHSYGANVVARLAGERDGPQTMVMLGPSYDGGLSRRSAGNLLVLTAEHEPLHITAFAHHMLRDATGGAIETAGVAIGELARGDARAWQVVPATDHVSLLFSADALERTVRWAAGSSDVARRTDAPGVWSAVAFAVLALAGAVALAHTATAAWSNAAALEPTPPPNPVGSRWLIAIWLIALTIAVLVGRHFNALALLRLFEGERIASLLAIAGVSMIALGHRRVRWPCVSEIARGLPIAAAAFAIVYFALALAADAGLYRLSLTGIAPERLSSAILLVAALSPFFAFSGAMLERIRCARGGGLRGAVWAGVATVALCVVSSASLYLVDPRLGRFAGPFGAACLFALAVGALLTQAARNSSVGALFSSSVTAWVIAVGFVRY